MNDSTDDNTKIALEAYRLSEEKLRSQTGSAHAADTRALSFAGILVATAAILIGFSQNAIYPTGLLMGAVVLIVAACLTGIAARPIDFFMTGAKFSDLYVDINQTDFLEEICTLAKFNDEHIDRNNKTMSQNNANLKRAFILGILGMTLAIISQFFH